LIKEEPTPLNVGDQTEGIVIKLDENSVIVQAGNRVGIIPIDTMRWARPPNPNLAAWEQQINHPNEALAVGDEILVRVENLSYQTEDKKPEENPLLEFRLEQEPLVQGALISHSLDGSIVAMVGGYDFEKSEFNRAIQAKRQTGSAFKPVIYSAAVDKGFTPATIIVDSPIVYGEAEQTEKWKPENYEQRFYGDTTFRTGLVKSRNVVTIKILQKISIPYALGYARKLGITSPLNPDLSLALGSSSLSLLEITKVFGIFPNRGKKVNTYFINKIIARDGTVLEEHLPVVPREVSQEEPINMTPITQEGEVLGEDTWFPSSPDEVISPQTAYIMTHLLQEVVLHGTGRSIRALKRPVAGKTGTTNDFTDALFIGFTPHLVTGVWTGHDDQTSLGKSESGGHAAAPIWLEYMKEAVKKFPVEDFPVPPKIVFASIDSVSGKLAGPNTKNPVYEAFISGTEPKAIDSGEGEEAERPLQDEETEEFFKEEIF